MRDLERRLKTAGVPSPRHDAGTIVQRALGLSRLDLLLRPERELSATEWAQVNALALRREGREPLQHLLGEIEWGGLSLKVTPGALIPRPETEVLLDLALRELGEVRAPRVLDVGTGTGALALGVKRARPDAAVWASDLSAEALNLARDNAARLGLDVTFAQGDLHAGLSGPFDLIVSNPPYLPESDRHTAQPEVGFDPDVALYAGPDGLAVARRLAAAAPMLLAPGGALLLELDPRNVHVLACEMAGWSARVELDLTGRARFLRASLAGHNSAG